MNILDVIVGYFLPGLWGWLFLAFVLISEGTLLSKYLSKTWIHKRIFLTVLLSNALTTLIGYFLLDEQKTGGHLINWIPLEHYHGTMRMGRTLFLLFSSFIGTIIIETLLNLYLLKPHYPFGKITVGSLLVNALTYLIGTCLLLYYAIR